MSKEIENLLIKICVESKEEKEDINENGCNFDLMSLERFGVDFAVFSDVAKAVKKAKG